MKKQVDLKTNQEDYALFLPALSGFYSTYVGRQRFAEHVPAERIPAALGGMEGLNFLNSKEGVFHYPWCLYSAGHANLDIGSNGAYS